MTRGEVWLTQVGGKTRPVLVLTRPEVIDVRRRVTIAEITTSIRGLAAEVELEPDQAGSDHPLVINCDGLHAVAKSSLNRNIGAVDATMGKVCWALGYALGC
jgi:mRNA-degrading endonuclease toxin of MazEF toxin-antitoxin module